MVSSCSGSLPCTAASVDVQGDSREAVRPSQEGHGLGRSQTTDWLDQILLQPREAGLPDVQVDPLPPPPRSHYSCLSPSHTLSTNLV